MENWLKQHLVCPRHFAELSSIKDHLHCPDGCRYPVVDGIPVMLLEDLEQTIALAQVSLRQSREPADPNGLYVDSLGLSDEQRREVLRLAKEPGTLVDPVVSLLVAATNGIAYKELVGRLPNYPIPRLRLPPSNGKIFLDLGCSWGRWCVAAARNGYKAVGIDPSLGAVMAARRVARRLGVDATYVVADARHLPFRYSAIDVAFSYSVLQHFARVDVAQVVSEIGRVLVDGGECLVQMPTKSGLRCLYHQMRRGFRDGTGFEVRYWSLSSLREMFSGRVGKTTFSADCFFGIGLQYSDLGIMSPLLKIVVVLSETFRLASLVFRPLVWAADSVYVSSIRRLARS